MSNYKLKAVNAQHFRGETAADFNYYRTLPTLLREIADWMEANDISDDRFDHMSLNTTFELDDASHYGATLYYRDK